MDLEYYKSLEHDISKLSVGIQRLSQSDMSEVEEYLEHGEYGLALETLMAISVSEKVVLVDEQVKTVISLATKMKISDDAPFLSFMKMFDTT